MSANECLALKPCSEYTPERLAELMGGRERLTPSEIAALPIPAMDRLWVLLRMAPREVWMPAIWRCVERAIRYAAWALDAAGLHAECDQLCRLEPIHDAEASRAASEAASAASRAASGAASEASWAASGAASWAASAASWASWMASTEASAAREAADLDKTIRDVVACLEADRG